MTRKEKRRLFIRELTLSILDHPSFRGVLKEIVLSVLVEQERIRTHGLVRSFMALCRESACGIYLDSAGRVKFRDPDRLTPEMRAVLALNRHDIAEQLKSYPYLEVEANGRQTAPGEAARATGARRPADDADRSGGSPGANGTGREVKPPHPQKPVHAPSSNGGNRAGDGASRRP